MNVFRCIEILLYGYRYKLFFAIILFDLVWIAEVKFAALAFAGNDVGHTSISWHMNKSLRQGYK